MEVRDWSRMLKERLRQTLIDQAQTGNPTTYKERGAPSRERGTPAET